MAKDKSKVWAWLIPVIIVLIIIGLPYAESCFNEFKKKFESLGGKIEVYKRKETI